MAPPDDDDINHNDQSSQSQPQSQPKVILLNAKYNHKYRMQEKKKRKNRQNQRPRLNQDDINFYEHFLQNCNNIKFDYDPITNNITFQPKRTLTATATDSTTTTTTTTRRRNLIIDGTDTGGQVIRFLLNWSIREYEYEYEYSSNNNTIPRPPIMKSLQDFKARSKGKGIMLYVQAAMLRLNVNESFTVYGGNPYNSDGPNPKFLIHELFPIIKCIFGISFRLIDETTTTTTKTTTTGNTVTSIIDRNKNQQQQQQEEEEEEEEVVPKFTLIRDPDVDIDTTMTNNNNNNNNNDIDDDNDDDCQKWESDQIYSVEIVDQLLMMIGFYCDDTTNNNNNNNLLLKTTKTKKKKKKIIVLKCKMTKDDYHVNAMIKVLKAINNDECSCSAEGEVEGEGGEGRNSRRRSLFDILDTTSIIIDDEKKQDIIRTIVVTVK